MPTEHDTNDAGGQQPPPEIIPPTPAQTILVGAVDVTTEMRDVVQQSLRWTGLSDDERQIVIEGELALTAHRKRGALDWFKVGEAAKVLRDEVVRKSNSTDHRSGQYSRIWGTLSPPQLKLLSHRDRADAVKLWEARDAILPWLEALRPQQRDRWHHPTTILRRFELARRIALTPAERDAEDEDRPRRRSPAVRRGQAAAIDDATTRLHATVEEIEDRVGGTARYYDLSSPQMVHDSAANFLEVYGGVHGEAAVQQFTEALRDTMGDEWHPGADWLRDELDEAADYALDSDEQRAVEFARTILRKWRERRGLPARADHVDITTAATAAAEDDDDPDAPPPLIKRGLIIRPLEPETA